MSNYSTLIGQTLSERYRLENQIGEGGQAVVWTGTDTESGQVRAIKLLPASFNTPPRMIDSFKDEGRLLVNLDDHENIVKVFDVGYDANLRAFYMIIGFVDGVTLGELIDARREWNDAGDIKEASEAENGNAVSDKTQYHSSGPDSDKTELNEAQISGVADGEVTDIHDAGGRAIAGGRRVMTPAMAVSIVRRVALALGHAHRQGLIHRDVKPSNILIGRNGDVKLTDFGIARLVGESGQTGLIIGTLQYMSPEQIRGHKLDLRTDIYSLGVVLYECLTDRTPFSFAERQLVPTHIINTHPQPPVEINAEVPIPLQNVVLRAMAKDPGDRYQTMTEFEDALVELVNSGLLQTVGRQQIAAGVTPLTGSINMIQVDSPGKLDSNQRCPTCGAPLPVGWQTALPHCPGCAGPLDQVVTRATETVAEFIRKARQNRDIGPGKIGLDMAMFLYSRELQAPTFQSWKEKTAEAEPEIQKGTVVMPAPTQKLPKETDLLATARRLMAVADFMSDPELLEYNQRIPELYEADALAAHARAKAYQLLGRHHTLRGSTLAESEEAVAAYNNARHNYILAGEQYEQAIAAWQKYENSQGNDRIQQYYEPVRDEAQHRRLWAEAASLLAQGILRFPHDRPEAYAHFHAAAEVGKKLQPTPGIALDLKVAEIYQNYYENALEAFKSHQVAIGEAQTSARQVIATAQTADAALEANDRRLVTDWLRDRTRIALDYHRKQEDLPILLRRIRLLAQVAGYALALVLALAFISEARHAFYTITNPGSFWPGWPMILAQSTTRPYSTDFGSWHFFLVMLAGIDWFIFWPFNLIAARQTPRARRTSRIRPVIPTLSQLAFPIVDWLDGIARRATGGNKATNPDEAVDKTDETDAEGEKDSTRPTNGWIVNLARLLFFVAPWLPIMWLSGHLWLAFDVFPGNYWLWLAALFLGPPIAGYFVGRKMLAISEKLDRLEVDETAEHEELDRKTLMERDRLRRERQRQITITHDEFARANAEHTTHRAAIVGTLQVLLARLLYFQKESDFVDLPDIDRTLRRWREEVDQSFLRRMGLNYYEAEVSPVNEAVWRVERPLNTLQIGSRTRPIPLRVIHNQDGYILWGIDGFHNPRRTRLQGGSGGYSLAVELPPAAQQVNFTFETADHRWHGEIHTIWVEVS